MVCENKERLLTKEYNFVVSRINKLPLSYRSQQKI